MYLQTLRDPWIAPPIRLGWGNFLPSGLKTAFYRTTVQSNAGATAFCIGLNPERNLATTAGANLWDAWLNVHDAAGSGPINTNTCLSYSPANVTTITATSRSLRCVSAALRVVIRYLPTNVRGSVFSCHIYDAQSAVGAIAPGTLQTLAVSQPSHSIAPGEIAAEVTYRPVDPSSFEFTGTNGVPTTQSQSNLLVCGSGVAAACFYMDIYAIAHYETLAGVSAGDSDESESSGVTLSASGVSMDQAGMEASRVEPVKSSWSAIEAVDNAIANVNRSYMRTGFGRGGVSGASSSFASQIGEPLFNEGSSMRIQNQTGDDAVFVMKH
jgi:hypothetical protein